MWTTPPRGALLDQIPPRDGAVLSQADGAIVTPRDAHVLMMEALGRLGWQEAVGYGKRSLVETAMGRYKGIIRPRLRSRSWAAQECEAAIAVAVLTRMTEARLSADPCNAAAYIRLDHTAGRCTH